MKKSISSIMETSGVSFGTSGARGLVCNMTDEVCYAYTLGFLQHANPTKKTVALGGDLRPSTPRIIAACMAAAKSLGFECDYLGFLPSPALALYGIKKGIPSTMVTGSHIPKDRNGIKFCTEHGEITKDDEAGIKSQNVEIPSNLNIEELPIFNSEGLKIYKDYILNLFPKNALQNTKIAFYQHSAVGRDIAVEILKELGASVDAVGRSDEFIPVDTEAIRQEDVEFAKRICEKYDCVISTDGDSDRPLLSDENGTWFRGDSLGIIAGKALGIEAVAIPVSCNSAAEKSGYFKEVLRTKIGSPFVIEGIKHLQKKYKSVAGYEANGGFLTESLTTRDALTPVIATIIESKKQGLKLSELFAKLPERFTASSLVKEVFINSTDGYRMEFENGDIVHLRKSGNAPEFRCYTESQTLEQAEMLSKIFVGAMQRWKIMGSKLYKDLKDLTKKESVKIEENIEPMSFEMLKDNPKYAEFNATGKELLAKGKVAAFLIAGGQGSRLGFDGPKGAFILEELGKSIFQIHAENLLKLGNNIPLVIMTSPLNNKETVEHFEQNNFFGLNKDKVKFIEQGTIFALAPNGELISEPDGNLFMVPDGNGGCFRALCQTKALSWFQELGVEFVFLFGVDNILAKPCDPPFIGAFVNSKMAAASKVVKKKNATEKMGVFAYKNGLPGVIEYSEISPELAAKLDGGNILAHLFTMDSLKKLEEESLPWHLAIKKVCGIEGSFKFEQLLFDAFPILKTMYLTGVLREEEFAPIKNASGDDSPATAVELFKRQQ